MLPNKCCPCFNFSVSFFINIIGGFTYNISDFAVTGERGLLISCMGPEPELAQCYHVLTDLEISCFDAAYVGVICTGKT